MQSCNLGDLTAWTLGHLVICKDLCQERLKLRTHDFLANLQFAKDVVILNGTMQILGMAYQMELG